MQKIQVLDNTISKYVQQQVFLYFHNYKTKLV
jgi:hypothetical protein